MICIHGFANLIGNGRWLWNSPYVRALWLVKFSGVFLWICTATTDTVRSLLYMAVTELWIIRCGGDRFYLGSHRLNSSTLLEGHASSKQKRFRSERHDRRTWLSWEVWIVKHMASVYMWTKNPLQFSHIFPPIKQHCNVCGRFRIKF